MSDVAGAFADLVEVLIEQEIVAVLLVVVTVAVVGLVCFKLGQAFPALVKFVASWFRSEEEAEGYKTIFEPYQNLIGLVAVLVMTELAVLFAPGLLATPVPGLDIAEFGISLVLVATASWLLSRLFKQFFDVYLLELAFKSGRKLNSEYLVVGKVLGNAVIILLAIVLFAQTHHFNIIGIFASLGLGGIAIAFAAQKTLEQLLGGIVLLIDKPFGVDDYIGLSDGTFGRVESIGLRSTRIRTSGKGTLVIIPNSSLSQAQVENFSGAKKVMSILYLNCYRTIKDEERALIRQVIHEATDDIFGLDPRSTDIAFREIGNPETQAGKTQVQCTFFILSSGSATVELRQQLLDVASEKLTQRLEEFDISFSVEEPTIYVNSAITI